jgi:hypothetical protein
MSGYGGVDLHGPSDPPAIPNTPAQGPVFSVHRSGLPVRTVTLTPGATAHVSISYLVPTAGVRWLPTQAVVTPPNETTQLTVPWTTGDPVLLESEGEAGAPTISPVAAGSSLD